MSAQLVWFKRDLRVADHAPLINAAKAGPVLCLYILEPALWQQPDAARQHFHFTLECLRDLYTALRKHGLTLQIHVGEATDVLDDLHRSHGIASLHSHQETGNGWSYERDLSVRAWCQTQGVPWQETPQFGVLRGLRDRALWQPAWQALMAQDLAPKLDSVRAVNVQTQWVQSPLPSADDLKLAPHEPAQRQIGGRTSALHVLNSFLSARSRQYRGGISSPLSAPAACSRLSPYLAMGCVSMREVAQQTWMRAKDDQLTASHRKGLRAFVSRLHRHMGKKMLKAGEHFGEADIKAAAKAQGVTIGKGDIVLFHTGWTEGTLESDPKAWVSGEPGLNVSGSRYLASLDVMAVGADTWGVEPVPPAPGDGAFYGHVVLLQENGIYLLETMNTGPLVRDGVKEFMFVLGQARIRGTVQMIINPVALY